jgi:hypothetical protein
VISVLINPYYGDTYSYPWKRGPHDNFNEYLEVLPVFDSVLRQTIYQSLCDFDFLQKITLIFNAEDETQQAVTRVAILRILIQMLRLKKEFADHTADIIIAHAQTMTLLNNVSISSKDGIVQASAL